ncbi:MAG: hypothetical protein KGJ55_06100 [Gammaproteobacteria bacterium]|nr:hypothetical protein [Gammaproteobacteria bacterium]
MPPESDAPGQRPLRRLYQLDLRSLAAWRVALALLLLTVWGAALTHAGAWYADAGVLPRGLLFELSPASAATLLASNGSRAFAAAWTLLGLAAALLLLAGWRSRMALAASLVLLASLIGRNPLVATGAEPALLLLLLWALFLPLGARAAADASAGAPAAVRIETPIGAALLLQIVALHWLPALGHSPQEWIDRLQPLVAGPRWGSALGRWLGTWHPQTLGVLLRLGWWLAAIGPPLLLIPFAQRLLRPLALALLAVLWLGVCLLLRAGLTPWVGWTSLLPLLPAGLWDYAAGRLALGDGLRLYHDDRCTRAGALALLCQWLLLPRARRLPTAGDRRAELLIARQRCRLAIDAGDRAHLGWDAWLLLLRASPLTGFWLAPLLRLPPLRATGTHAYRILQPAALRMAWPRLPAPHAAALPGRAGTRLALAALVLFALAATGARGLLPQPLARPLQAALLPLRLNPVPSPLAGMNLANGWFAAPATRADGSRVDLLRDGTPLAFGAAAARQTLAQTQTGWRALQDRLAATDSAALAAAYSGWLCRRYGGGRQQHLRLVVVLGGAAGAEQHLLWQGSCR